MEQVFDSRSLAFAEQIRERTGGDGVDVVLNTLGAAATREKPALGLKRWWGHLWNWANAGCWV